ncbi:MAG: tetratricopeptide repeat protein, partial [Candidatus Thorarchaeota archaeon]
MDKEVAEILAKAEELSKDEEHEEALELIQNSLSSFPHDPDIATMQAVLLVRLDRDTQAESILNEVLAEHPHHESAISALGRLFDNSLRCDEAENLFRMGLEKKPDSHIIIDDLCRLLIDEGRMEEAYKHAKEHSQMFPDEHAAYDALRFTLVKMEDKLDEALGQSVHDYSSSLELASNLVEQFFVFLKIQDEVGTERLQKDDVEWELHEDMFRVIGELENVKRRLDTQKVKISKTLEDQIISVLKRGR